MVLSRRGFLFVLLVLIAAVNIPAGQQKQPAVPVQAPGAVRDPVLAPIDDETAVVLPAAGKIDERPFFSSSRHPVIEYPDRETSDVVGELARKVDAGAVRLRFDKDSGFLLSVLEALHVPAETQAVIFSKTSLQSHYISPSNPRALFYKDDVSVGFIRNAPLLEIAALDPQQGVVFYAIDNNNQPSDKPQILRHDSCLSCHQSRKTLDVPGMLVRSVGSGVGGEMLTQFGDYVSDHRSPFEQRWGGWFITGNTGAVRHMGNTLLPPDGAAAPATSPQPLTSLDGKFDLAGYPSHYSDVAAVLVLNHQVRMTNLMTRVGWETRIALDQQRKNPRDKESAERLIAADARELADYILFAEEAPFPAKLESTSAFQTAFAAGAPKDSKSRSLKQLDLNKRLLKYPCSYMIYSRAFDGLPLAAKDAVYARMWAVLSGKDASPKYSKLTRSDRAAVVDILMETKPGLPTYFRRVER
jgi:hypothetical protein